MAAFRVTFSTVTPESTEQGDYAESGFYSRGGWKHDNPSEWTLREVVSEFGRTLENDGRSFSTVDADTNYATGEETFYTVHPPSTITGASYRRLARVLTGKKVTLDNLFQKRENLLMSKNIMVVSVPDGREVLYSYGVPVAAFIPGMGYIKRATRYSVTTSKHANAYCRKGSGREPVEVPVETFLSLIDGAR